MFTNNIDAINAAFYLLDKKEDEINYYYEPRFVKKEKDWKRCYIINELRKDFIKDINNFGFSPFIECSFKDQKNDKNIMKYFKLNNYDFAKYIKQMNSFIHGKHKIDQLNLKGGLNNTVKNQFSKSNLFYKRLQSRKKRSYYNLSKHNKTMKNKTPKAKKLTEIVKFSREEEYADLTKLKQMNIINNDELESSFNYIAKNDYKSFYEPNSKDITNTKNSKLIQESETLNKVNDDDIIIHEKLGDLSKRNSLKNKIKSYSKLLFNAKKASNNILKIRKIKIKKEPSQFFKKRNIQNNYYLKLNNLNTSFGKNKTFSVGKKGSFSHYLNLNELDGKNNRKNLYLERLENYSGGIFKSAKKYHYSKNLKKK